MDTLILVALRDALVFAQECSTSPDVCDAVGSYNRMLKVASCPFEKFPMKLPTVPPTPAAPTQPITSTTTPEEQGDVVDFGDSATDVDEESQQAASVEAAATKGCPSSSSSSAPAAPPADVPSPMQRAMDILLINQVLRRPTTTAPQRLEDISLSNQEASVLRNCVEALYIAMPGSYCRKLLPSPSSSDTATPHPAVSSITALLDAEFAAADLKGKLVDAASLFTSSPSSSAASGISDPNLRWWQGDMSLLKVDAMVNPANCAMLGCFKPGHRCLDNILHCKGGPLLRHACHCQLESDGKLESGVVNGGCMVTAAFNLPAKFVFHTVGPCLFDDIDMAAGGTSKRGGRGGGKRGRGGMRAPTQVDRAELASCYRSCLASAFEYHLNTIAFCCISTGVFGYPLAEAANIAVRTCKAYLDDLRKNNEDVKSGKRRLPKVVFNVFKDEDREEYKALLA